MIAAFVDSRALFDDGYLAGVAIAALLSLVGVFLVTRDRIFLGAALAQSSMLGITIGIRLEAAPWLAWLAKDFLHTAPAVLLSVAASLLVSASARERRDGEAAITGWIFLAGASFSVLLIASSEQGLAEMHRVVAGTMLGGRVPDTALFAAACIVAAAFTAHRRDELLLLASDPHMARVVGMPVALWENGLAVLLGTSVALAVHVSGFAYTFGCLVLPALAAKSLCAEMRQVIVVAPAIGITVSLFGFLLASHQDLPPAPTVVALLCVVAGLGVITGRRATAL